VKLLAQSIQTLNQQVDLGIWHRLSQLVIALIVLACLIACFLWYLPVFKYNARLRKQILNLETQIAGEEESKAQLQAAIHSFLSDPKTVERIARQKLGYAKPGETVIFFEAPRDNIRLIQP
jgi:cell division protein FtsB